MGHEKGKETRQGQNNASGTVAGKVRKIKERKIAKIQFVQNVIPSNFILLKCLNVLLKIKISWKT